MRYYKNVPVTAKLYSVPIVIGSYFVGGLISIFGFANTTMPHIIILIVGIILYIGGRSFGNRTRFKTAGLVLVFVGIVGFFVSYFFGELFGWGISGIIFLLGTVSRKKRKKNDLPLVNYCKDHLTEEICQVLMEDNDFY
jgi:hypothetical protein